AGVLIACDERPQRGPLEGLYAGLSAIAPAVDAVYATSCDVPLLVPAFVQAMIDSLGDADIAVPVEENFAHPLAGVYRTSVLPHIRDLLAHDKLRPAFLFDRTDPRRIPVAELTAADPDLHTLRNLNLPDDYIDALRLAGF